MIFSGYMAWSETAGFQWFFLIHQNTEFAGQTAILRSGERGIQPVMVGICLPEAEASRTVKVRTPNGHFDEFLEVECGLAWE